MNKRIIATLAFWAVLSLGIIPQAQGQNEDLKGSWLEPSIGYTQINDIDNLSLGLQYSYAISPSFDIIGGVQISNGHTRNSETLEGTLMYTNNLAAGARFRHALCNRLSTGLSVYYMCQHEWESRHYPTMTQAIGIFNHMAGARVELMYGLTASTWLGLYGDYQHCLENSYSLWSAGLKASFRIQ